jgi:hypothetical protein
MILASLKQVGKQVGRQVGRQVGKQVGRTSLASVNVPGLAPMEAIALYTGNNKGGSR